MCRGSYGHDAMTTFPLLSTMRWQFQDSDLLLDYLTLAKLIEKSNYILVTCNTVFQQMYWQNLCHAARRGPDQNLPASHSCPYQGIHWQASCLDVAPGLDHSFFDGTPVGLVVAELEFSR